MDTGPKEPNTLAHSMQEINSVLCVVCSGLYVTRVTQLCDVTRVTE